MQGRIYLGPSVHFTDPEYKVSEDGKFIEASIIRGGDIHHKSYVRCYTRQDTASAQLDFIERDMYHMMGTCTEEYVNME